MILKTIHMKYKKDGIVGQEKMKPNDRVVSLKLYRFPSSKERTEKLLARFFRTRHRERQKNMTFIKLVGFFLDPLHDYKSIIDYLFILFKAWEFVRNNS